MTMARKNVVLLAVIGLLLSAGSYASARIVLPGPGEGSSGGGGGAAVTPATFTIGVNSACSVNLSWTPEQGYAPTSLTVLRDTTGTFTTATTLSPNAGTTSYSDTSLTPGASYFYEIKGIDKAGNFIASTPASVTTNPIAFAPSPTGMSVLVGGGNALLQFTASNPLSAYGGYTLKRTIGNAPAQTLYDGAAVPISGTTTFGYSDSSFSAAQQNVYTVSFFESDYGCASNTRNGSGTMSVTVPAIPNQLTTKPALTPAVLVSWNPAPGATYVEIWKRTGAGAYALLTSTSANSINDTTVAYNTSYAYKVRACANTGGNVGCSDFSAEVPAIILPDAFSYAQETMGLVARASYAGPSTADVVLSWSNVHPNTQYQVQQSPDPLSPTFTTVRDVVKSAATNVSSTASLSGLSIAKKYQFRIRTPSAQTVSEAAPLNLNVKARLNGTAWSSMGSHGIGWVSVSCETDGTNCSSVKYNVFADDTNELHGIAYGLFSGSHGYSWLSFNKADLAGCPDGHCVAQLDTSVTPNRLLGWAKFIAASSTGWDGWVSLNSAPATLAGATNNARAASAEWKPFSVHRIWDTFISQGDFTSWSGIKAKTAATVAEADRIARAYAQSAANYGVTYDPATGALGGQAWGSNITGWLSFGATMGGAPVVSNVSVSEGSMINPDRTGGTWCDDDPYYAITWNYSGSNAQQQAKITFYNASSGLPYIATTSTTYGRYNLFAPLSILAKNTAFTVGVSAFDGAGWSPEVKSAPMTTPTHYYPLVQFIWSPTPGRTAWPINFSGTSTLDRSSGAYPAAGWFWQWVFPNATSTGTTGPTATAIFDPATASSTDKVTLTVTDGGHACALRQQVLGSTGAQPKKIRDIKER